MGSGGGSDSCDPWDVDCHVKKATGTSLADIAVNGATLGLAGVDENGNVKKGAVTRAGDETVGELSGRNAARKAQMDAKDAVEEEKLNRAKALKEQQEQNFRNDVTASNTAGAVRATAAAKSKNYLGASDPEKDFLGL
ncbi:MAG: hypothetical protein ACKOX6_16810 [Bdellovibrio sp.]